MTSRYPDPGDVAKATRELLPNEIACGVCQHRVTYPERFTAEEAAEFFRWRPMRQPGRAIVIGYLCEGCINALEGSASSG